MTDHGLSFPRERESPLKKVDASLRWHDKILGIIAFGEWDECLDWQSCLA
jgi:hypothetical protein